MEVTRKNFKETLPLVSASIKKADFLVIDAEFTGLINGRDVSIFDSPEEYYTRLLNGSTEFLLIQYGLCAFYWDAEADTYMNDAYNFYLFPRGRPGPEKIFLCQSSSLDFLAAQGFDFNKLIREGISYMTEPIETKLRENLTERQKTYSKEKDSVNIPDENKPQIEDLCKKVRQFIDDKKEDNMEIDRCNAFVRYLLIHELGTRFKDEVYVETKVLENKNRIVNVVRIKPGEEIKDREKLRKEKEWNEFEDAVGFSKVARMISQSEKLVIGHNMLLDVLHTLNHFFQPLPSDYASFKEFTHCMFPRLIDTKYMSSLPPFKDKVNSSVLHHLLVTLSEAPFTLPHVGSKNGCGYSQSDVKHHEAGYDAYVTGLCFLAMYAHLSRMRGEKLRLTSPNSAILKPFLNKLFLAKTAHQDSPYINLTGAEPTPSRDHVFHLTFPKEWQRNDLNQLFSPFGPITTKYLDDTSALVALSRREQARDVLRTIGKSRTVTLTSYSNYKNSNATIVETLRRKIQSEREKIIDQLKLSTSDLKTQQVVSSNLSGGAVASPEKPGRVRANSVSTPGPQPARKRTSSGVFQVDDAEPPPKKPELIRSEESSQKPGVPNGKQTGKQTVEREKKEKKEEKRVEKFIEKFDSEAKNKCVTAFKESDSWD